MFVVGNSYVSMFTGHTKHTISESAMKNLVGGALSVREPLAAPQHVPQRAPVSYLGLAPKGILRFLYRYIRYNIPIFRCMGVGIVYYTGIGQP